MNKKPASLHSFIATKNTAAPSPLAAPVQSEPANDLAPVREAKTVTEELVALNLRVPKSYRHQLKKYALDLEKSIHEVVLEGIELHRQKNGRG